MALKRVLRRLLMKLYDWFLPTVISRGSAPALLFLLLPASAYAQTASAPSFRIIDLILLAALAGIAFFLRKLHQRASEDQATRAQLIELLEARPTPKASDGDGAGEHRDASWPTGRLDEIRAMQSQQGLIFEGMQEAQIMVISRLEELLKESQSTSTRLSELRSSLQEGGSFAKHIQKMHKEVILGVERVHVTLSGLVSAFEALKVSDRRDAALLNEVRTRVSQLNARLIDMLEVDQSLDPTVIGAPDAAHRMDLVATRTEPLRERIDAQTQALESHTQALEIQNQALELQSSTLESVAEELRRQQVERHEQLETLQRLMIRLASLEEGLGRLEALETHTDSLREQLGELQADIGLVLKARPIRHPGHGTSPYDPSVANEYYTNLQKLVRVAMKNEKASTYALEAVQYLHEALQLQTSLCEVLSSAEFSLRVAPQALEEGVVKPLLTYFRQEPLDVSPPATPRTLPAPRADNHDDPTVPPLSDEVTLSRAFSSDDDPTPDLSGIEPMVPAWDAEEEEVPAASELNQAH